MSFTVGITIDRGQEEEIAERLLGLYHQTPGEGMKSPAGHQADHGTMQEAEAMIQAAALSAEAVLADGALGENWTRLSINVSGHANVGHTQTEGWANDFVNVSITVLEY